MPKINISTKILAWYDTHGRKNLPWRKNINAYRVWLSEIMLQQTQVKTVIPYFNQFIRQFPTVKQLAQAHEDEVLHLWSGLGYYSRARNLHKTAKIISEQFNNRFPSDIFQLQQLPGIGRSTAGAIAAIAFQQATPILDGNVKRVLIRFLAMSGWSGEKTIENKLWESANAYTPQTRVGDYTQAIMDLGAMICVRTKPHCRLCPLQKKCRAYLQKKQDQFPAAKPKKIIPIKSLIMLIIKNKHHEVLLEKRPSSGIWGGLWSLPECDLDQDIKEFCHTKFKLNISATYRLDSLRHTFTHFHLNIHPVIVTFADKNTNTFDQKTYIWYTGKENIGMAAAIKNVLKAACITHD